MEKPVTFSCNNKKLYGILHVPDNILHETIVLMVVGGYQTRYGSHRLYIQNARYLAMHGHIVLRFDYEGRGDSHGEIVGFRNAGPSIDAAIEFLIDKFGKNKIVVWSLCDGASASAIYAYENPKKIAGLILVNTYASTENSYADARLRYYYTSRLKKTSFWKKMLGFKINYKKTLQEISETIKKWRFNWKGRLTVESNEFEELFPEMILSGLKQLDKPITCIIANEDILAKNFFRVMKRDRETKRLITQKKIKCHLIKGARHTFDQPEAKKELFDITLKALNEYY